MESPFVCKTHYEADETGHFVCAQYCEFQNPDGTYCNEWLGYNYPALFCNKHPELLKK